MKLWGGRFGAGLDPLAARFNASIAFDRRLADVDVRGSVAWVRGLARAGVITPGEASDLCGGLQRVWAEFSGGTFAFDPGDEDIHTAVERRLGEIVGSVGGKLHTGRSRNDQVATDFRLWLAEAIDEVRQRVRQMQTSLLTQAEMHFGVRLPGYTHLQRAQPVLFSHWLLAHFWSLERDRERLTQTRDRSSTLPLGSGALAGTAYPIDREHLALDLGFARVSRNSLDAVSDRDFAAEFLFDAALLGSHVSRLAEALILYSSSEFGFIELSDSYATGSSLMPQKKNPDVLELARGKAGTLVGLLTGLLATIKALPSAYDKDLQEDKPPVFAAFDLLAAMLPVLAGAITTMTVKPERMEAALDTFMLATDLADYLVRRGVPFRDAHTVASRAVRRSLELGRPLDELSLGEWQALSPIFDETVKDVFDFDQALAKRNVTGGTGPDAVRGQLVEARSAIESM